MNNLVFDTGIDVDGFIDHIFFNNILIPLKHPNQDSVHANLIIRKLPMGDMYAVSIGTTRRRLMTLNTKNFTLSDLKNNLSSMYELSSVLLPPNKSLRSISDEADIPLYLTAIYRNTLPINTGASVIQTSINNMLKKRNNPTYSIPTRKPITQPLIIPQPQPASYLELVDNTLRNNTHCFNVTNLGYTIEKENDVVTFTSGLGKSAIVVATKINMLEVDPSVIWELVIGRIKADIDNRLLYTLNSDTNEAWEAISGHVIGVQGELTWKAVFDKFLLLNQR